MSSSSSAADISPTPVAASASSDTAKDELSDRKIKVQSGDGEILMVDLGAVKLSKLVKGMIDDLNIEGDQWNIMDPILLANVSGPIMKKIIPWMEHHKKTDKPEPEKPEDDLSHFTDDITEWDEEFLKVDQGTLFELILASNYLNIKKLRTACCKTVAAVLKKKSVEQIRELYNIQNDFTPEEEEAIRKENEWCEDQEATPAAKSI